MINVKAKDSHDWNVWHYGLLEAPDKIRSDGRTIEIVPRTVCENTGIKCRGQFVYENDWLEADEPGETHKFLVAKGEKEFRAFEDETVSYNLREIASYGKIIGNLYD